MNRDESIKETRELVGERAAAEAKRITEQVTESLDRLSGIRPVIKEGMALLICEELESHFREKSDGIVVVFL